MVRFRRPAVILLCVGVVIFGMLAWLTLAKVKAANSNRSYEQQAAPEFLFEQRPIPFQCADRPQPLPPGQHSWLTFSGTAPYARTRAETLNLPLADVPALTIASDSSGRVRVAGKEQSDWKLQFCAVGEGDTAEEARQYLDQVSMSRTGSLISLEAGRRARTGSHGDLWAQVPRDAPLTLHTIGAIEVRDLSGPLRISAGGRATILHTTGIVEADGEIVDFAGARGQVRLNSFSEIDIKLTGPRFLGNLTAYGQREVRVLVPHGFESPIEVMVDQKKDLVCRADFCSQMKQKRFGGAYIFRKYAANEEAALDHIFFRSDHSTVVIDNWYQGPFHRLYP
jgi:hypothetical protein